jgi:hypothetical protein
MPEEPAALARRTLLNAPRHLKVRPILLSSSHFRMPCMRWAYDQLCCSPFAVTPPRSYGKDPSVNSITHALLTSNTIYHPGMS